MKRFFVLILLFLSLTANSQQLSNSEPQRFSDSVSYIKSYWQSGLTVLSQPLHYDWKDWTAFAGVAATSSLAFIYDDEIFNLVNGKFTSHQSKMISRYTDIFGEELFILPTIAATYAIGAIDKNPRLKNLSLATLQSFVFAEVASAGIKVMTCRERPQHPHLTPSPTPAPEPAPNNPSPTPAPAPNTRPHSWQGPFATFESTSFVSGHATRSFALATTIAGFYPDKKWVGIVSYSLAAISSVGRIICNEHWTSDVVVGAALGYFIGRGVVKFNEKIGNISSVDIQPITTNYGIGVAVKL